MKFLKDSSTRIGMALLGVVIALMVIAPFAGPVLKAQTGLNNSFGFLTTGRLLLSDTAPTVTSAGSSPSVTTGNGAATFIVNVGTGGTASAIVMAMPAATTGWTCTGNDITAAAANTANVSDRQTASTTTSVTMTHYTVSTGAAVAFTASDLVRFICAAY